MAAGEITIRVERRPCVVHTGEGGIRGMFHRWADYARPHTAALRSDTSGQYWDVYGLVEYEDGSMHYIEPNMIQFVDHSEFSEYSWEGEP